MKKKLIISALSVSLVMSSAPIMPTIHTVEAAAVLMEGEVVYGVNFRTSPSTSSQVIRMLSRGENVDIIEEVNDYWYKIRDKNGRTGYVSSSAQYIRTSAPTQPDRGAASDWTGEVIYGVNFRTAPSTSSQVIRMLSRGENVDIIEEVNDYWYKIRDKNGRTGYVSSSTQYIRTNTPTRPDSGQSGNVGTGEVIYGVNFRTGPSTSSQVIRMLPRGENVDIIEEVNDYWYKIRDKNGRTGYVSSSNKYILLTSGDRRPHPAPGSGSENRSDVAAKVIAAGMKYLGTPYEYGSNRSSTATFDCSDFVRRTFIDALGVTLPMDSRQQGDYVKQKGNTTTNWRNLEAGDLMFFMSYRGPNKRDYNGINKSNQRITHVGIYMGDGKILHTYSVESGGVRTDSVAGRHWEYRFLFGGSAL